MSESERRAKAMSGQGKLTAEQRGRLRSDLLQLMDGKTNPKSEEQLVWELVQNFGWEQRKIDGPRPYMYDCLERLENDGLVESRNTVKNGSIDVRFVYWRKPEESAVDGE